MNLHGYKTVKQYSTEKGITPQAIYQQIEKGKLKTYKVGNLTLVKEI